MTHNLFVDTCKSFKVGYTWVHFIYLYVSKLSTLSTFFEICLITFVKNTLNSQHSQHYAFEYRGISHTLLPLCERNAVCPFFAVSIAIFALYAPSSPSFQILFVIEYVHIVSKIV